jgi:hypothetical protein
LDTVCIYAYGMTDHIPRRVGRFPANLGLALILDPDGEKTEVQARTSDLSQYGTALYAEARLEAGQLVEVIPNEGPEFAIRARVIWVGSPEVDKGCPAGLEFLVSLPASV